MQDHLIGSALTNTATGISVTFLAVTDTVNLAIVAGAVNIVIGVATIYFAYRAKVIGAEAKQISAEAKDISAETHKAVNGKMEEFKKMAEAFYHAKGVSDERTAAEVKLGSEAIAKAIGKAEGKAEVVAGILTEKLQTVASGVSADKTVDIVDKLPPHK